MTIEWLAGNRIRGTSTERTNTTGIGDTAGGWVELGRTTLGSTGNNIDVSSLPDKRYYMFLTHAPTDSSGYVLDRYRLNNDSSGTNGVSGKYSYRSSLNGSSPDGTGINQNEGIILSDGASIHQAGEIFTMGYIANKSDKEKLLIGHTMHNDTAGAGTAPDRGEGVGKHAQTSNPITSVNCVNTNNSGFASGSEMIVLGWDPADTHTANFWEELASVEYSGGTALTSGTIPAKKYLWVQAYLKIASGTVDSNLWRFNADIQNHYAARYSRDGATDPTPNASISHMNINFGAGTRNNQLINMFIINNSANEKLVTGSGISQGTSGSGTAPNRLEFASKWANTTDQITSIQCTQGNSLNFEAGTIMKVWGSD